MTDDTCDGCLIDYPPGFVYPFREHRLCGVCALNAWNTLHSTHKRKFHTPVPERLRLAAIAYRHNPQRTHAVLPND